MTLLKQYNNANDNKNSNGNHNHDHQRATSITFQNLAIAHGLKKNNQE